MPHPLALAAELVERYAPECSDRDIALGALDALLLHADADQRHCRDCQQEFFLCAPERLFFQSEGLAEPTRCKKCRQARKRAREQHEHDEEPARDPGHR